MTNRGVQFIRGCIIFWTLAPLVVAAFLLSIIAIMGYFAGPHATGFLARFSFAAGFIAALAPIVAAHISVAAASIGLIALSVGLRTDAKTILAVSAGMVFGAPWLFMLYLQ